MSSSPKMKRSDSPLVKRLYNGVRNLVHPQPAGIGYDALHYKLIRKHAAGKSFVDIGCMWRINGAYAFFAEESGATKVIGVDISEASKEFWDEKAKRNSSVEFIQGDIHTQETIDKIGVCDLVFNAGVLYHTPNPFVLISRLRMVCGQTLILSTAIIPEMKGIQNGAVFYPFLSDEQRKLYDRGGGAVQIGITGPYEPQSGYANWFWGLTPSCVESLLQCAGFAVKERFITPTVGTFVCQTIPVQFAPVSGD